MKLSGQVVSIAVVVFMVVIIGWQSVRIDQVKTDRDSLSERLTAQRIITDTTLSAVTVYQRISGETIDAKRKNTLDAQSAKKGVKAALVGDGCASVNAPDSLIDRMRQYKD